MEPIKEIKPINNGIRIFGIENIGIRNNKVNQIRLSSVRRLNIPEVQTNDYVNTLVIPQAPPVTERVGTPIVYMPGCVQVHKENAKNPKNKNKMLVDDDPKGNTVLCDAGAPYFYAPNYDARELSWQTIYTPQEEADGLDTGGDTDVADLDTPEPPATPSTRP